MLVRARRYRMKGFRSSLADPERLFLLLLHSSPYSMLTLPVGFVPSLNLQGPPGLSGGSGTAPLEETLSFCWDVHRGHRSLDGFCFL